VTAQIWLLTVLSGLGIGIMGWAIRGWQASGREMRIKRKFETLLCAVEADAKRILVRAREQAAEDRRRLEAERDALQAWVVQLDPTGTVARNPGAVEAAATGVQGPVAATSKRSRRLRPRNGNNANGAANPNGARRSNGAAKPNGADAMDAAPGLV